MQLNARVQETTTTTGTGDITLAGAVSGCQAFSAVVATGQLFPYVIEGQTPGEWERGMGYLSGSTTLVRDSVRESSNSGALVSLSSGTKNVFMTFPEEEMVTRGAQIAIANCLYLT